LPLDVVSESPFERLSECLTLGVPDGFAHCPWQEKVLQRLSLMIASLISV